MRHHPHLLSLKVSLYSKEYLPDLFTNADEPWWLHKWQRHLQTGLCNDSVCHCDQHLLHYHNIHLAFAHRLASIFNLFILHSVDIYFLPTMSWTQRYRDECDRDAVLKEFTVQESQPDVDSVRWRWIPKMKVVSTSGVRLGT